ncbi:aromatic-ring-hydroxylating dioxygenase subunit beta [Pigmentiphaga sp. NML080357]|uniref:aromatic-ring-hydroxylating dioxygenase subunit beta n=1 Tax=Pigmentiphaga sp. NML080357 TaxID=2008675 RepID=UPI001303740E|nr:aromatic-ring-hydroxylating dioxygenase subunit beta [Pigmentiphaga sp. NML080357]
MSTALTPAAAAEFLYREALLLDRQRFDDWVGLYADDAVYWIPAWKSEHQPTDNPDTELSLLYCASRSALVDRVWRLTSNLSVASMPLARTSHSVTNVLVERAEGDCVEVCSSWSSHVYNPKYKSQHVYFGSYEHTLRREDAGWKIARKKIMLLNDFIPTVLDLYMV